MEIKDFIKFSSELEKAAEKVDKQHIKELIFSLRCDVLSVCVVVDSINILENIIENKLPAEILKYNSERFFVDLESLNTEKIRIYIDSPDDNNVQIYGYYLDKNMNIYYKKVYKPNKETMEILIDHYDETDNLIIENDVEIEVSVDEWKGPKEIYDIAEKNGYKSLFLRKRDRDQYYFRVLESKK